MPGLNTFLAGLRSTGLVAPLVLDGPMNEQAFAKLKALLRGAAARTKETLWTTIGQLHDRLEPAECLNYLTNSGYEFT